MFLIILSSLIYFLVFKSEYYSSHELNRRVFQNENTYLRGKIIDREENILVYSEEGSSGRKRIYSYGEALLHPVGYFNEKYGSYGIEKYMDKYLREPKGFFANLSKVFLESGNLSGSNVKLTLHGELQKYAYDILGNNKGAIVLMNPKTGEIYSLVSKPAFDPNYLENVWNEIYKNEDAPFYNRATNGMYPPGSTFKIITSAMALEKVNGILEREFNDEGYISFNENEKLSNQNEKSHGLININKAFVNSSNTFFGSISMETGNDLLKDYAEKFYFNKDLNLPGLNISRSYFPKLGENEIGLIAQSGIGQGATLSTPILMGMVSSVISNGGILNTPYIISEISDHNQNILMKYKSEESEKIIEEDTSNKIKSYMRDVVEKNLSHINSLNEINAGGKTGTADYKKNGEDGIPHSWFVGFAPYENPKISIAVIVEEGGEGRGIASSVAGDVMKRAIELIN